MREQTRSWSRGKRFFRSARRLSFLAYLSEISRGDFQFIIEAYWHFRNTIGESGLGRRRDRNVQFRSPRLVPSWIVALQERHTTTGRFSVFCHRPSRIRCCMIDRIASGGRGTQNANAVSCAVAQPERLSVSQILIRSTH